MFYTLFEFTVTGTFKYEAVNGNLSGHKLEHT